MKSTIEKDELMTTVIPKSWILLDSASSISLISNSFLVEDIKKLTKPIMCYTNGDSMKYWLLQP